MNFFCNENVKILKKKLNKISDNETTFHVSALAELILWNRYITKPNLLSQCNFHKIPITFFIELAKKAPKFIWAQKNKYLKPEQK